MNRNNQIAQIAKSIDTLCNGQGVPHGQIIRIPEDMTQLIAWLRTGLRPNWLVFYSSLEVSKIRRGLSAARYVHIRGQDAEPTYNRGHITYRWGKKQLHAGYKDMRIYTEELAFLNSHQLNKRLLQVVRDWNKRVSREEKKIIDIYDELIEV